MEIRFLADASLNGAIVSGCKRREPTMDFLSANDAKLERVPDPEVLALAAAQNRILVSHDFQTMPRHLGDFLQAHGSGPGVILVPQYLPIGEAIDELVCIWGASDAEEWANRIFRIPLPWPTASSKNVRLQSNPIGGVNHGAFLRPPREKLADKGGANGVTPLTVTLRLSARRTVPRRNYLAMLRKGQ